jgi:hypothetical protein
MHGALLRGRDWARVGEGIMRVRGGKRESVEAAKAHLAIEPPQTQGRGAAACGDGGNGVCRGRRRRLLLLLLLEKGRHAFQTKARLCFYGFTRAC